MQSAPLRNSRVANHHKNVVRFDGRDGLEFVITVWLDPFWYKTFAYIYKFASCCHKICRDEEYDKGKRKKIRGLKHSFGGPNLFQEIAIEKSKCKRAKLDQSCSGNPPFRIWRPTLSAWYCFAGIFCSNFVKRWKYNGKSTYLPYSFPRYKFFSWIVSSVFVTATEGLGFHAPVFLLNFSHFQIAFLL